MKGPFLKVLFLQEQPCIRALKYAKGLRECFNNLRIYYGYCGSTLNSYYGQGDELFDGWFKLNGNEAYTLESTVGEVRPDVIHCHNAPDTLSVASIRFFKGLIPIVHDIHDLLTLRNTMYDDGLKRDGISSARIVFEERVALERSDGIIAVSEAILDIAKNKYRLARKKNLVFPNYVLSGMIPAVLEEKLSAKDGMIHIVYEGHLDSTKTGGHYDLYDIFRQIARQDMHIHLYPSRENEVYMRLAAEEKHVHYHGHLRPDKLMTELTRYDFGWSGFNTSQNREHTDTVLANKTIEYISAGIPVITFPHKSQKRFMEQYAVGIVIESLSNLRGKLSSSDIVDIKRSVLDKRRSFTVENQIEKLHRFYMNLF
jgi:glycosyltransferase involved in cell wall biosynthesis